MFMMPLPRDPITHFNALSVASGFLRNANPKNIGAAPIKNCARPKIPLRLIGFSKNFVIPSRAVPADHASTLYTNLPIAANP